jgi:hypothetical protein
MQFRICSILGQFVVGLAVTFHAYGAEPAGGTNSDVSAKAKSVTIFPIVLNSGSPMAGVPADMPKRMAELIGLFLERGGMEEIEIAEAKFSPPEKADLDKTAEAFGRFVSTQGLKTEYAIFGQFFGTPGKGVDEIRLAVVDRQGKTVLSKRLDRQQLAMSQLFSREKKIDPMLACDRVFRQLQSFWALSNPDEKGAPEGKMSKLWAEKSGLPSKAELQSAERKLNELKKNIQTSTVAVYPVRVSGKSDAQIAERLAEMLGKANMGRFEASEVDTKIELKGNTNQTRILWDMARAFRDFLKKNPPTTDYALLVDYGIGRTHDGKTMVGGIQMVVCDRRGDWVLVELRNSHHGDFQRIAPQSADDCNRVVVEALKGRVR